jgi:hypothetical protein
MNYFGRVAFCSQYSFIAGLAIFYRYGFLPPLRIALAIIRKRKPL